MQYGFEFKLRGDFARASSLEWLEANGLGGYASSTACGANTRRYHGILVPATHPPVGRMVLLSKLDERLIVGGETFDLSSNQFPTVVHPHGYQHLAAMRRDLFPSFEYVAGGVRLRKTIAAIHGENTTVIVYEVVDAPGEITFELRPFLAARDYHSLSRANDFIHREGSFDGEIYALTAYDGVPTLFLSMPGFTLDSSPDWYYHFEYPIEQERGLEAHEDLFTPGLFRRRLRAGAQIGAIASIDDPRGRDALALLDAERRRREAVVRDTGLRGRMGRALALASDQFIARRGTDRRTVIAGYHWFTDWGRDTMIALPGLCLSTRRFDDARQILLAFAESVSQGMLPNRFPDRGEAPEYNTVDATLWFFVAARKYLDHSGDTAFIRDVLLPVLRDIIVWHTRGTRHDIHVDEDDLLAAGRPGDQLTWMDAKIGDEVVTPRHGKPVEVNALWYNALSILADFERRWGSTVAARQLGAKAARVRVRFRELFWNEKTRSLFDVVRNDGRDASIRPNQILAITLPFPIVDEPYASSVLQVVESRLLTPFGLRTLDPDDPKFVPTLIGPPAVRDRAYHQGIVWPWLLGPYISALVRLRGKQGHLEALRILAAFEPHLEHAGVGTVSEVFDATPPYAPRGCIAQAWSVGELLRAMTEDLGLAPRARVPKGQRMEKR